MENYYTILDMDEDSPYIPIPHLVNIEFGSDEDDDIVIDPSTTQFLDLSKYFDHDNDGEN